MGCLASLTMNKKFVSLTPPFTPDECDVRHVQPYEAIKAYICPYCSNDIEAGLGHEVVVPKASAEDRRHFHSGCWNRYLNLYKKSL